MLKRLIAYFILFFSYAVFASSPNAMLQNTANQIITALKSNKANLHTQPKVVYGIMNKYLLPVVDKQGMARSALGRDAWMQASSSQKQAFTNEFMVLLIRTYAAAFSEYTDETVKFQAPRSSDGGYVQVDSQIIRSNGPAINVSYSCVNVGGTWKVFDVSVEGVSVIQSFRSQFSSVLNQGGMDALIAQLKQHNRGG